MKNIHLDGAMRPVADGGTYAYVQHSFVPFPVEIYPYGIHSVGRNQLVGVVYAQVGGGKADFSSYPVAAYHCSVHEILVSQTACCRIYFALPQKIPDERGTYRRLTAGRRLSATVRTDIRGAGRGLYHIHTDGFSVTYIVVEPVSAVASEAVVVSYDEAFHPEAFFQYVRHKLFGGEACHFGREVEHQAIIHSGFAQQASPFFGGVQQLRAVIALHHLAGMNRKGDQCGAQSSACRYLSHLPDKVTVSCVYSVEETDGRHTRFGRKSRYVVYDLHVLIFFFVRGTGGSSFLRLAEYRSICPAPEPSGSSLSNRR